MRRCLRVASWLALACLGLPGDAAGQFDPARRFRSLRTEHFVVHFHEGGAGLAGRLAAIAEEAWEALPLPRGERPGRTEVVLVDQTDLANGWATPVPYNAIVVTAAWPPGYEFIGHTEDWLRLVFTHEFAHIVHLDRSAGWARLVRQAFGRTPLAFPNLLLPAWQIEGLATYEESAGGRGRAHAADFRAIEHAPARAGRFVPLHRVNGGVTDWPGGAAPYAYGLGFHEYLATRYSPDHLERLARETARSLPYMGARAFRRVFGQSLGELWRGYQEHLIARGVSSRTSQADGVLRVTRHGFITAAPRFTRHPCDGCAADIVYASWTPHEFPALYLVHADGSGRRRIATRYLGVATGLGEDLIVFDQLELRRNVALYRDLYAVERSTGRTVALSTGERLGDPDLSPDGRTIVCVQEGGGERSLVLAHLGRPDGDRWSVDRIEPLRAEPDTRFNTPRWSPDGRFVVAGRHRLGALPDIVVVEIATGNMRVVASRAGARIVTPVWTADGTRVIAAADFDGTFELYDFAVTGPGASGEGRALTSGTGGAMWPDVSPDGSQIVFVGYTVDGFDIFTMPYERTAGTDNSAGPVRHESPDAPLLPSPRLAVPDVDGAAGSRYSPWQTLRPTMWTPVIETSGSLTRIGGATGGRDVLGYHAYGLEATWVTGQSGDAVPPNRLDWRAGYAYQRWRPTLFASYSQRTTVRSESIGESGPVGGGVRLERAADAGVQVAFRRVRFAQTVLAALRLEERNEPGDSSHPRRLGALQTGWALTSARRYGYSISAADGVAIGVSGEWAAQTRDRTAATTTVDVRAYLPGAAPHHVVALRAGGGASSGAAAVRRRFRLGGAGGAPGVIDPGEDAFGLLRGFPTGAFAGSRVLVLNGEYRWPFARPQWGWGTAPLLMHSVHGALFVDAGHAWDDAFSGRRAKVSAGGEISIDVVLGYGLRTTVTTGVAWGRDGAAALPGGQTWYARVGSSF